MLIWIAIIFILTLFYGLMMLIYLYGWLVTPEFILENTGHTEIFFSVIIPMRNEEKNVKALINDLLQLKYPANKWEAIFVDDYSEDDSIKMVEAFACPNISVIAMKEIEGTQKNSRYKKQAIETGIANAKGSWIVTTDADCHVQPFWLQTLHQFIKKNNLKMVAAPVLFQNENSGFGKMQSLDFCGLMGITAATLQIQFPTMCNGANLAFEKKVFSEVNGYHGKENLASGDDLFLMHKVFKQYPAQVKFLKSNEAAVTTKPVINLKEFFWQRVRWTSKSKHYTDKKITAILILSYLFNVSILINASLMPFSFYFVLIFIFQLLLKMITEFGLLVPVCNYFKKTNLIKWFLPAQLFHIFYVTIIGVAGITMNYEWKKRNLK